MFRRFFFSKPRSVNDIMWINMVAPDNIIWSVRVACWKFKTKKTHSEYIIFIVFPWQIWLRERALILRLYAHCPFCILTATTCLFSV